MTAAALPRLALGAVLMGACAAGGCICARSGDRVVGVIDAPAPILAPLGGAAVCVARLEADYYSVTHQRSSSDRSALRYAPEATFAVEGRKLAIVGRDGDPVEFLAGESWQWRDGESAPAALRGWGEPLDTLLRCTEPRVTCRIRNLRVTERLIACGEEISLRGEIQGNTFVLHPR
jgi:hypothetical protein